MSSPLFSGPGLVALSGGVDSAVVLALAVDAAIPVEAATIVSEFTPQREIAVAKELAKRFGVPWHKVPVRLLENPDIAKNPENRCYLCKKTIMSALQKTASSRGFSVVYDGTNKDDIASGTRPGIAALQELHIKSPLAAMTKDEVIAEAEKHGITVRPPSACLATRIPFNTELTVSALARIDEMENQLRDAGITGMLRVRAADASGVVIEVEEGMLEAARHAAEDLAFDVREVRVYHA